MKSVITIDRRRQRASLMTSMVMRMLDGYIPAAVQREAAHKLERTFYESNFEVISAKERAEAGLTPLNEYGMDPNEHAILQAYMTLKMMEPQPMIVMRGNGEIEEL